MSKNWKLVNSENVIAYDCGGGYISKMLTGDEMAGIPVININEGTLAPYGRTGGETHSDTEIYYIVDCGEPAWVCLDEARLRVKPGDFIIIPGGVFHYIDNLQCAKPFILYTFWPNQEQNGVFHTRHNDWGTSVKNLYNEYTEKRLKEI